MRINFELNPPKLVRYDHFNAKNLWEDILQFIERARNLVGYVNGIHLTDSDLFSL
jgi:hypothetical protein